MDTINKQFDKFYYYRLLAEAVWGKRNRILKTTSWRELDATATPEQKEAARKQASKVQEQSK